MLYRLKYLILALSVFSGIELYSQEYKRAAIWYFGNNAGLDFNYNPPKSLNNSLMDSYEGCASISDTNGNILIYTNGERVWNRKHQVMKNGTGLNGHLSSAQGCIIVPNPGNDFLYYLFTTDAESGGQGVNYNLIDLGGDGGYGEIRIKNILLYDTSTEKLAAVKHKNGRDIWVVHTGRNNNNFYAYLINENGLVACPVISAVGTIHDMPSNKGYMKFSFDGKKFVNSKWGYRFIELFDFDNETGIISNPVKIYNTEFAYGIEFSSNSHYLYVTERRNALFQFDISSEDETIINNSKKLIYSLLASRDAQGLQMGINGKIYMSEIDEDSIDVINYPDSLSSLCDFKYKDVKLDFGLSEYGMPNYIASYFYFPNIDFKYQQGCTNDTVKFQGISKNNSLKWNWSIKHLSSGKSYTDNGQRSDIVLTDTGYYSVELITDLDTIGKTFFKDRNIPKHFLQKDTFLCPNAELNFDAGNGYYCYTWNDSIKNQIFSTKVPGTFYCTVTNNSFCSVTDTITVYAASLPEISLTADTAFCPDEGPITLNASIANGSYTWQDGSTLPTYTVVAEGVYRVTFIDTVTGCKNTDSILVVKDCQTYLYIPSAFTPNGDGLNETFEVKGSNLISYRVSIYSNQNEHLFSSSDIRASWDATYKGEPVQNGNYMFIIYYRGISDNNEKMASGKVMVLR